MKGAYTLEKNAEEIWENTWPRETHITDYALKRINSAKSAKLTPLKIDTIDFYGYFQGSSGKYETFLDSCPCGDFRRSKLPCKHIYRLAMELGLMDNTDTKNNINAIITPKNERTSLDETIDLVESLPENVQRELLAIAANIRSTTPTYLVTPNENVSELIKAGIVVDAHPGKYMINYNQKRKSEIAKLLDDEGIVYEKKATKNELQELCTEHLAEKAAEKFGKFISVSIPTKYSSTKIHYYLHRKYDYEMYVDEEMKEYNVSLLNTELPDDDVTIQLIKRGYYSPQ